MCATSARSRVVAPTGVVHHFERLAPDYHATAFAGAGMSVVSDLDLTCVAEAARRVTASGRTGLRVCDVGVGTGRIASSLESAGLEVTGVDVCTQMLSEARSRLGTRSLALASLSGGLPLSSASFDLVTCMRVLKYLPCWPAALAELARLVRPGGLVCFDLANRRSAARFGYPAGLVWSTTYREASEAIEVAGLEVISARSGVHLPDPVWRAASTPKRASALRATERLVDATLGRHGARSWTFIARRIRSPRATGAVEGNPQLDRARTDGESVSAIREDRT